MTIIRIHPVDEYTQICAANVAKNNTHHGPSSFICCRSYILKNTNRKWTQEVLTAIRVGGTTGS